MTIETRLATKADFDTVYRFINELENQVFDRLKQELIYLTNLQNPNIIYLLAIDDIRTVGLVTCHVQELLHHSGRIGEIQEMFVEHDYRSRKVGQVLLSRLREIAAERKVLQLEVTSNKVREQAHRFYLREGFKETHFKFTLPLE